MNNKTKYIKLVLVLLFLVIPFVSVGYSALQTTLNINGDFVMLGEPTLYNVFASEANNGNLVREYVGSHQDTMAGVGTSKIYYWYAPSTTAGNTLANEIIDKNNVIFAGYCWQMIRTTDTGGVKMIYNGEPDNGTCLNTRGNHVGVNSSKGYLNMTIDSDEYYSSEEYYNEYYFSKEYDYDESTGTFTLVGDVFSSKFNEDFYDDLRYYYTCGNNSTTCSTLKKVLIPHAINIVDSSDYKISSSVPYYSIGKGSFNYDYKDDTTSYLNQVGYKNGRNVFPLARSYIIDSKTIVSTENVLASSNLSVNYYYANDAVYGSPVANAWNLVNPYKVSSSSDYPSLAGKYTFLSSSETTTGSYVYYIVGVVNNSFYYLYSSGNNPISSVDKDIYFSDSIVDNGNGTYSLSQSTLTSVKKSAWFNTYQNYSHKYTCGNENATCSNPRYVISTTQSSYNYADATEKILVAKGVNGFNLTNTLTISVVELYENNELYSDYKYTCLSLSDVCTTSTLKKIKEFTTSGFSYYDYKQFGSDIAYSENQFTLQNILGINDYDIDAIMTHRYHSNSYNSTSQIAFYVYNYLLSNNGIRINSLRLDSNLKNIDDIYHDLYESNDVNSNIKELIDKWFYKKLYLYSSYLEDVIYCNDRYPINKSSSYFNPNGGNETLQFNNYSSISSSLSCNNSIDKFSVSNNDAKLTYKVGLFSAPEMNLLGNNRIRSVSDNYWLITPYDMNYVYYISTSGSFNRNGTTAIYAIRPAISLVPGTEYVSGDGSMANPYVVEAYPLDNNRLVKNTSDVSKTFGKNISRNSFESITIVKSNVVPNDAIDSWDVSVLQNGSIMAWYTDSNSNGLYELYIGQLGGVKANVESDYAFYKFEKVTLMDLRNFKTTGVTSMYRMFENTGYSAGTFTILGLSNFDTSSADNMLYMFRNAGYNSTSCDLGNLSSWDVSNVTNMSYMLSYTCKSSPTFDLGNLSNWDTSNVSNMSYMFYHGGELASVWNIGTLNISASNISYMFNQNANANCSLNILKKPTQYSSIFGSSATNEGHSIIVNYTSDVSNIDAIIATKSFSSNVEKGNLLN